jgi:hypothetical protein
MPSRTVVLHENLVNGAGRGFGVLLEENSSIIIRNGSITLFMNPIMSGHEGSVPQQFQT